MIKQTYKTDEPVFSRRPFPAADKATLNNFQAMNINEAVH